MGTQQSHSQPENSDFNLSYHGRVSVLLPLSPKANEWLDQNIILQDNTGFGRGVIIEHRSLLDYVKAINASGLRISKDWQATRKG